MAYAAWYGSVFSRQLLRYNPRVCVNGKSHVTGRGEKRGGHYGMWLLIRLSLVACRDLVDRGWPKLFVTVE